jgi:1-phosphofructokinase family hexose kinase
VPAPGSHVAGDGGAGPVGPVVTVTVNPAIDHTVRIPHFRAGEVNRVVSDERTPGGKGVNVAAALRALDVETVATGLLGEANATLFEEFLAVEGIADRFVRLPGATRTGIKVVDDVDGTTTDINFPGLVADPGAVARLTDELGRAVAGVEARWVALAGSLPPGAPVDLYARLAEVAHRAGARVAVDTSGPALREALAAQPDLVKPNVAELEELVGRRLPDMRACRDAVADLQARGIRYVVVSMGADGALFVDGDTAVVARPPAVAVASTVGAGDATVAGSIAALLRGEPLAGVARLATACGATAVATVGPRLDSAVIARLAAEVTVEEQVPDPAPGAHPRESR